MNAHNVSELSDYGKMKLNFRTHLGEIKQTRLENLVFQPCGTRVGWWAERLLNLSICVFIKLFTTICVLGLAVTKYFYFFIDSFQVGKSEVNPTVVTRRNEFHRMRLAPVRKEKNTLCFHHLKTDFVTKMSFNFYKNRKQFDRI